MALGLANERIAREFEALGSHSASWICLMRRTILATFSSSVRNRWRASPASSWPGGSVLSTATARSTATGYSAHKRRSSAASSMDTTLLAITPIWHGAVGWQPGWNPITFQTDPLPAISLPSFALCHTVAW
jgi:hypothetical protein